MLATSFFLNVKRNPQNSALVVAFSSGSMVSISRKATAAFEGRHIYLESFTSSRDEEEVGTAEATETPPKRVEPMPLLESASTKTQGYPQRERIQQGSYTVDPSLVRLCPDEFEAIKEKAQQAINTAVALLEAATNSEQEQLREASRMEMGTLSWLVCWYHLVLTLLQLTL